MDVRILRLMNILPVTLYPALAQETRLRCLLLLLAHDELCVCELTYVIGAAQPTISRHLAHLPEAHLVVDRREGLWIHYRINPGLPAWVLQVLRETARGVRGMAPFLDDLNTLKNMPNRPDEPHCD
jgi:ArsR family transcriptional regulator, arsenate/arsenite/antimonite-responsive transcriptional repressor